MLSEPPTKTVLLVEGGTELARDLRARLRSVSNLEIVAVNEVSTSLRAVSKIDIDVLVVDGRGDGIDPLHFALRALEKKRNPALIFTVFAADPLGTQFGRSPTGPRFVTARRCAAEVERALGNGISKLSNVNVLDLVRIARLRGSSGGARIRSSGRAGTIRFEDGSLVHAATDKLKGADGFLEMVLWPTGKIEEIPSEFFARCPSNIPADGALIAEAIRFRSELQDHRGADDEPFPISPTENPNSNPLHDVILRARDKDSPVRVVVACADPCECLCFGEFAPEMARELGVETPWMSESSGGPSFGRIHAASGEKLALTFVPVIRRHAYLLETLAKKAEAVVVCDAAPRTDVDGWKKRVADGAALAFSNGPDQTRGCIKEVLRQLACEKRPE